MKDMKTVYIYLIMLAVSMTVIAGGCKKKNTEPADNRAQFVGTWQGTITFTGGTGWTDQGILSVRLSGDNLIGYVTRVSEPVVMRLRMISFANGIYSFEMVCANPDDPDCQTWNVTGTLTISGTTILQLSASGTFCGPGGGIQGTVTGDLTRTSPNPDDSNYITFAQAGREWHLRITDYSGNQCTYILHLDQDLGNGIFSGTGTTDCNWPTQLTTFYWYVQPGIWCDMRTASLDSRILNIRSDAQVGDTYQSIVGNDTITVTILSLNDQVVIDGKTYDCIKGRKYGHQWLGYSDGYFWMQFNTGLIKYEALQPNGPTDVHYEELVWRNF
jgi:hypothetical protein